MKKEKKLGRRITWKVILTVIIIIIVGYFIVTTLLFSVRLNQILQESKQSVADSDYLGLAFDNRNSAYCEKIIDQDLKDRCFSNVGIITKNVETCKNIRNLTELYYCAQGAKGDFSFCKESNSPGECYQRMAIITNTSDLCTLAKEYSYICYVKFAERQQSTSFCQNVDDTEFFNWCMAVATRSESYCAKMPAGVRFDMCYQDVAKLTSNIIVCNNILVETYRNDCITDLALAKNDPSQCNLIESDYGRRFCQKSFEFEREKQERANSLP